MCRIITKRRLEYYRAAHYDKQPLFKEGDIVWLYQEPLGMGTGVWLVYEAKVRKPLAALQFQFDTFLQLGANMPVYDVELPWPTDPDVPSGDVLTVGQPVMRQVFEIFLFEPKTILIDEMFCSIGENNVTVLHDLSESKKRKVPKDGLVFLGRTQFAEVRKQLESTGHNEHANCDTDLESEENAESEPEDKAYRGQNKSNDVWKGHGKKRKRRSVARQPSRGSSAPKPRVTFSGETSVIDNGVIIRIKEEPRHSPPPRREAFQAARKSVFGIPFPPMEDTDSDSLDHGPSTSMHPSAFSRMPILARKSVGLSRAKAAKRTLSTK